MSGAPCRLRLSNVSIAVNVSVWADASLLLVAFRISIAFGSSSSGAGAAVLGGAVFFFAAGGAVCFGVDGDVSCAATVPTVQKMTASTNSANKHILSERIIAHLGPTLDFKSHPEIVMESFHIQTSCWQWERQLY